MQPPKDVLIAKVSPLFSMDIVTKVLAYYDLLIRANRYQNLTRLTSPNQFYEGHLLDVLKFEKTFPNVGRFVDLGSGCGVPGLLSAVISNKEWLLVEKEIRKAEFLRETITSLDLSSVEVNHARLQNLRFSGSDILVSRAVAPIKSLLSWLSSCSTWNQLVLFKGPAWEKEWSEVPLSWKVQLDVDVHPYVVGEQTAKHRVLLHLKKSST